MLLCTVRSGICPIRNVRKAFHMLHNNATLLRGKKSHGKASAALTTAVFNPGSLLPMPHRGIFLVPAGPEIDGPHQVSLTHCHEHPNVLGNFKIGPTQNTPDYRTFGKSSQFLGFLDSENESVVLLRHNSSGQDRGNSSSRRSPLTPVIHPSFRHLHLAMDNSLNPRGCGEPKIRLAFAKTHKTGSR